MPRSLVKGRQIQDEFIRSNDLAKDSVITEKIKDGNVTCPKLEPGLCDRLLSSSTPIGRMKIYKDFPAGQEFTIPGGLTYDSNTFVERVAIYKNGQLLYNGNGPPAGERDPEEVWPGSTDNTIVFNCDLIRGDTIQVMTL